MSKWSDSGTWSGNGLRREVFFFPSGGVELYGSLYVAAELSHPWGLVACGSWGVEADRTDPLVRSAVLGLTRLGGAGMIFHYPGYGDSNGDPAGVGLTDLSDAAADALAEAARRRPDVGWFFAGFMVGAAVACLARRSADVNRLLLVQPSLRPGDYFRRLGKRRQPLAPGPSPKQMMEAGPTPEIAYGYPVPQRIVTAAEEADRASAAALASFSGDGAVVHHEKPPPAETEWPPGLKRIEVPGTWRFGALDSPRLSAAVLDWLQRMATAGAPPRQEGSQMG